MSDLHRAEALATFNRSIAFIAGQTEKDPIENWDLVISLAVMGTLGPPPSEADLLGSGDIDITEVTVSDEALTRVLPGMPRVILLGTLATEILEAVMEPGECDDSGWSADPEVRACQIAVQLQQEHFPDPEADPRSGAIQNWDLAASWLGNHDTSVRVYHALHGDEDEEREG